MNADVSAYPRHHLSTAAFESLAGGGGDASTMALARLWEQSWRAVVLHLLLKLVGTVPQVAVPAGIDAAWRLIAEAQRADRHAANRVLQYPSTGIWAAYSLRRLRGSATSDAPLWVDLGHLSALAAAAALRARVDFSIDIPVRDGVLTLPTLGCALIPGPGRWRVARVQAATRPSTGITVGCDGRMIVVDDLGVDGPHWMAVRDLRADAGGVALRVALDDLDPYRELLEPTAPARLTPEQVTHLSAQLGTAWALLAADYPDVAEAMAASVSVLSPLPRQPRFRPHSASSDEAFGAILLSEPDDAIQMAVTLVHEFQHNKLGALQHLFPLVGTDAGELVYAPWRDDPRPVAGLIQGVYAFTGVTDFWRRRCDLGTIAQRRLAQFEFALWRTQTWQVARELSFRPELTDLGRAFLQHLKQRLAGWQDEPVAADLKRLANLMASDHRAQWRAFHVRPDPEAVGRIADAWLSGASTLPPIAPAHRIVTDRGVGPLDARAVLLRWQLVDAPAPADLDSAAATIAGVTAGDVAYLTGRHEVAHRAYLDDLERRPDNIGALVGLGLVLAGTGDPAATTLLRHPEVVLAVSRRIRQAGADPDLPELARRLAG